MRINLKKANLRDKDNWVSLNKAFMKYEIKDDGFWNSPMGNALEETFDMALKNKELITLFMIENEEGKCIGFANLMTIFSVWSNGKGLILDDLFITEDCRGRGYGKEVMNKLEEYAVKEGYKRFQFQSEDTNKEAYEFYTKLGYSSEDMKFYIKHLKSSV